MMGNALGYVPDSQRMTLTEDPVEAASSLAKPRPRGTGCDDFTAGRLRIQATKAYLKRILHVRNASACREERVFLDSYQMGMVCTGSQCILPMCLLK
jgi:hypothetical protein